LINGQSVKLTLFFSLALAVMFSACVSSRQFGNNRYLLTAQTIQGNHAISDEQLESLIPQKPNRRILGLPITPPLWFYQLGLHSYDQKAVLRELDAKTNEFEQQSQQLADQPKALKRLNRRFSREAKKLRQKAEEGNWLMRNLGEQPSYFAESDAKTNAAKMQRYLVDKGFFNAQTSYSLDTLGRRQIRANYRIDEKAGFHLRTVLYAIADPRIDSLVRASLNATQLRSGDRFDVDNLAAERVRIESLLRDQGYYLFSRQYIRATDVDTNRNSLDRLAANSAVRRPVSIRVDILNPPNLSAHPIFHFGEVDVRISPNADAAATPAQASQPARLDSVHRNGVTYFLEERNISTRLLDGKVLVRPGALYSQSNYRNTQRNLFLLNQFKLINLNFVDSTNRRLRTLITATPLDKYETTFEGGLFVLSQAQPGPFTNVTFRVRNLFGGLETFEATVRYGLEYQTGFATDQAGSQTPYPSNEFGAITSITFPQMLFPGRWRFRFNQYNPRTQVSISFNNTIRPDYKRSLLRSTMAYNWQTTPAKQFSFLIADINLINASFDTKFGEAFQRQLKQQQDLGSTVYLSFRRSLSSSFSFAYTYNTNVQGQTRRSNFLRTAVESGGTTLNLFSNRTIEHWSDTSVTGLQFYKFLRFSLDYRHYVPIRARTTLAFRFNTGLVYGYGPGQTAPYEKLFFAGGSNSIRGWLPRRLGPGAELPQPTLGQPRVPILNPRYPQQFAYTFEKPGDMLIEASAELRGRLFHFGGDINGALFVDAGNVWTIRDNPNRYGDVFKFGTFFPQIAVGTGVGIRVDFSFFVIRFDGGIKVWDPARQYLKDGELVDERFLLPKFSLRQLSSGPNPLTINFGIGYPF
jgi:outer membrane protein assembly factor BamA